MEAMAWHGMAWHGMAWHGMAWHGMAWHGMACHGMAWLPLNAMEEVEFFRIPRKSMELYLVEN